MKTVRTIERPKASTLTEEEKAITAEQIEGIHDAMLGVPTTVKHTRMAVVCQMCGLHFTIRTWFPKRHTEKTIYCPECGVRGGKAIWMEEVEGPIYKFVGMAELAAYSEKATKSLLFKHGDKEVRVLR